MVFRLAELYEMLFTFDSHKWNSIYA